MNEHRAKNEAGISRVIPHVNGRNTGVNGKNTAIVQRPAQMGGQNSNNRYDMSQIS